MVSLREIHVEQVVRLLSSGPATRAGIREHTGLSRSTVSGIVGELVKSGVAVSQDPVDLRYDGAGRPRQLVALSERNVSSVAVVFQIAGISIGIAGPSQHVINATYYRHRRGLNWRGRAELAVQGIRDLCSARDINSLHPRGIGVGVTGPVQLGMNDGPWRPALDALESEFNAPVQVESNLRLNALAEATWGAGRGDRSMVYFHIEDGVGGGIILNGQVYRGANGAAGEFGHVTIDASTTRCRCGKSGCLEQTAALPAILRRAGMSRDSRTLADLADDPQIQAELTATAALCGATVGNALAVLDISSVVIGGILADAHSDVVDAFSRSLKARLLPAARSHLRVSQSMLTDTAGVRGGIALIQQSANRVGPPQELQ